MSGARSGVPAAAPPTSDLAQQDRDQDQDQDQDDEDQAQEDRDQDQTIKIRMMTPAILAGTIPTTPDATEKTHRLSIHKRSAA